MSKKWIINCSFILSFYLIAAFGLAYAQDPNEATRKIWDTAFINSGRAHASKRKKPARSYRITSPAIPVNGVAEDTVVGVTIWRLRRSVPADTGERLIVHEESDDVEWLPERISANTRLAEGDRLRISVEAARSGYLYVIDREQYADGSLGEPYLIFPTTRTLNSDNSVKRGKLVEIPAQDDGPPYFRMRRSRPDQVAEVLSLFVTPTPIEGLTITDKAQKLSETQVATWEKQWSAQVGAIELEGGAGKAWTKEEREASLKTGPSGPMVLNAHAPAPQLIYYRPNAKASEPMLVKVQLRYHSAKSNR
ncbi:MAG TPA: DUF4384 domain-containing protein [Pyrinomonadaceae bacterium]|nr:DUF4384 domain-containing protein [Pyrinomonadaceae bacterium]